MSATGGDGHHADAGLVRRAECRRAAAAGYLRDRLKRIVADSDDRNQGGEFGWFSWLAPTFGMTGVNGQSE